VSEIIFEVREDEVDGGYTANALGYGIHTQGDTVEEVRAMVKDAVQCYFDETMEAPRSFASISWRMNWKTLWNCAIQRSSPKLKQVESKALQGRPDRPGFCSLS